MLALCARRNIYMFDLDQTPVMIGLAVSACLDLVAVIVADRWQVLPQPCFECIRAVNYMIWSILAARGLLAMWDDPDHEGVLWARHTTMQMCLSINVNYVYELLMHTPDIAHTIHHFLSIALNSLALLVLGLLAPAYASCEVHVLVVDGLNKAALISSVFSSLRAIVRHHAPSWHKTSKSFYKCSYIIAKCTSMALQWLYIVLVIGETGVLLNICYACLAVLHSVQLYFVGKILMQMS